MADKFEEDMRVKKDILQKCQNDRGLNSCYQCEEILTALHEKTM